MRGMDRRSEDGSVQNISVTARSGKCVMIVEANSLGDEKVIASGSGSGGGDILTPCLVMTLIGWKNLFFSFLQRVVGVLCLWVTAQLNNNWREKPTATWPVHEE